MSTRCNIMIQNRWDSTPIWIYHHHDGYLEGVGKDLNNRLAERKNWYATSIANELLKDQDDEYELTDGQHGDIEYLYKIFTEAKVMEVWEGRYEENSIYERGFRTSWVLVEVFDYSKFSREDEQ